MLGMVVSCCVGACYVAWAVAVAEDALGARLWHGWPKWLEEVDVRWLLGLRDGYAWVCGGYSSVKK